MDGWEREDVEGRWDEADIVGALLGKWNLGRESVVGI